MLPFLLLLLVSASVLKSDCQKLRYVHVLWRHGDRAPLEKAYPNDPHGEENWPRGWAQLTTVGMKQMQDLGHFLRQRYAGTFLSARYDRKEVFVRSTDVDRTIESAQSLLSGMFPPEQGERFVPDFNWQPVAIHSAGSNKRDPLLHPWTFPCPLYQKLFVPIRDESDRRLMSKYKNLVDFVQPHLGLPQGQAVKIMDMMHLRHIMPEIIHNLTQPEWVLQKWPQHENKTSIELIWEMRAQNRLPNFHGSEEITKLIGGVLLADWLKRAEAIASGNQSAIPTKMTMYSAHDATLLVLLSALKVALPEDSLGLPPYASCIIMELYGPAEGTKEDEFHVKFVYRRGERLEELVLDGCPTANCPLATFSALVRPRAILDGETELTKMCTIDDQQGSNSAGRTENTTIRWLFLHFGISLFLAFFRKLWLDAFL